jgi:serine/threonine protein kinase
MEKSAPMPATIHTADCNPSAPPTLLERYTVLGIIGQGGMGTVYKGYHLNLERHVAIKTLRVDKISTPDLVNRFRQEMKLIGQMDHDNVVRATDAGEKDGVFYLVMEYLSGSDLDALVKRRGPLCVSDACELIRQAALGLDYIHQSLVHRDIKPSNLMLTMSGTVKILDLGLAFCELSESAQVEKSSDGYAVGTYSYMAPEQAVGRAIDGRADLYSLGCTMFKLLTGKAPYSGPEYANPANQFYAHSNLPLTTVQSFQAVPDVLKPILLRMVAKRPGDRYQTAKEVAAAIAPYTKGSDPAALASDDQNRLRAISTPIPEDLSRLTVSLADTSREIPTATLLAPPRPDMRKTIGVSLATCALTAGLAALIWFAVIPWRPIDPPKQPVAPIANANENPRYELLNPFTPPFNHEKLDANRWEWNARSNTLHIHKGRMPIYFALGDTNHDRFHLEANIHQAPWNGNVGIFWGYQEENTKPVFATLQMLTVIKHPPGSMMKHPYAVERSSMKFFYDDLGIVRTSQHTKGAHAVPELPDGEHLLTATIQDRKLTQVMFQGISLNDLCDAHTNEQFEDSHYKGRVGIFSKSDAAMFSRFTFIPDLTSYQ